MGCNAVLACNASFTTPWNPNEPLAVHSREGGGWITLLRIVQYTTSRVADPANVWLTDEAFSAVSSITVTFISEQLPPHLGGDEFFHSGALSYCIRNARV